MANWKVTIYEDVNNNLALDPSTQPIIAGDTVTWENTAPYNCTVANFVLTANASSTLFPESSYSAPAGQPGQPGQVTSSPAQPQKIKFAYTCNASTKKAGAAAPAGDNSVSGTNGVIIVDTTGNVTPPREVERISLTRREEKDLLANGRSR